VLFKEILFIIPVQTPLDKALLFAKLKGCT